MRTIVVKTTHAQFLSTRKISSIDTALYTRFCYYFMYLSRSLDGFCNCRKYFPEIFNLIFTYIWDKLFKNGRSKICGRQPLKNSKGHGLIKQTVSLQIF